MYYLYLCICTSAKCMSVELKVHLFIWSLNFRFSMSLSLSPNYRLHRRWRFNEGALYCQFCVKIVLFCYYICLFQVLSLSCALYAILHLQDNTVWTTTCWSIIIKVVLHVRIVAGSLDIQVISRWVNWAVYYKDA